jgi:formylglycine-generating enzyme
MLRRASRTTCLVLLGLVGFFLARTLESEAWAVRPDEASPEASAQVLRALKALEPLYRRNGRELVPFADGTIERAIRGYAPKRAWPVAEGVLPSVREGLLCPQGMRRIHSRYCIDAFEAHLEFQDESGAWQRWSPFAAPKSNQRYRAAAQAGIVPQAYLSQKQAMTACNQAGKRLCSAAEWRGACGGSQLHAYPYGGRHQKRACNDFGKAPMLVYYADKVNKGFGREELNDPRLNQLESTLLPAGSLATCKSDDEVFDMVGNLHEWTADPNGTFQGGYYLDTREHGEGCAYRTIAHNADYADYSIGFRCCADGTVEAPP